MRVHQQQGMAMVHRHQEDHHTKADLVCNQGFLGLVALIHLRQVCHRYIPTPTLKATTKPHHHLLQPSKGSVKAHLRDTASNTPLAKVEGRHC